MQIKIRTQGLLLFPLLLAAQIALAGNPCNPGTPADRIDAGLISRPAGTRLAGGDGAVLAREGELLWNDKSLSRNGMACQTCHAGNAAFNASFAQAYPHKVAMVRQRAGLNKVALDEMVQFCMLAPMAAKPLAWDSRELAALTAYAAQLQKHFKAAAAGTKQPHAAKNPCAPANPCAPRH